ncbi:MAG: DMT family transporter [Cyclobacteriaceae bacterium]
MIASTADYFKLHFVIFLWGFTAILGLLISIPAVEMVLFRTLLAAIGLGVLIYFSKASFKVSRGDLLKIIGTGFIVGIHWIAFFASAKVSNASVSLVGFATGSLWTAFLDPLFGKKRIKGFEVVLGLVVVVGLYVIFSFDFRYPLGLALGIASGFTIALFSIFNAGFVKKTHPYTITFFEMIGAFLCTALFLPLYKNTWAVEHELQLTPSAMDWFYIAILSLLCTVYAYSASIELLKRLSVFFVQLSMNLEPLYGIIMAVLVFGASEKMQVSFYVGTAIILCAVLSYPLLQNKVSGHKLPDQ